MAVFHPNEQQIVYHCPSKGSANRSLPGQLEGCKSGQSLPKPKTKGRAKGEQSLAKRSGKACHVSLSGMFLY
jgi:hypothetical protein